MKIKDNNAKASINFQKANMKVAAFHNAREAFTPKSSHAELAEKNECSCSALAAIKKIQKWDAQADVNYAKTHGGRRSPVKESSKVWEAVVNLRENHTMADVKKLVKKLEQKTGYKAAQIAIHRDEGHVSDDGDFIQNIHAHILFYARDPKTGLSLSTKHYGKTEFFEEIQDLVADELKMERGRSARETGAKHENMHSYKARKQAERAERTQNKEWEAKLAQNNKEWEARKAEWEAKQAAREARQAEWEKKIPEIVAARERRSKYISEQLDWEHARTGKMLAREMQMLGVSFAGIDNPQGNILVEAQKSAIRNIFYMLGVTAQLAVVLMKKTIANDEKLAADAKIYNVESTLLRAVDYIANSDKDNGEELKIRIQRTFLGIPEDKREELFLYALENAPTPELKNDIKALIEGRFEDIAKSEAAQKRIENRDLKAALRDYAEEARKIKEELKALDEESRILNLAERALLKDRGANREQYAEQEAENRERLDEIKKLKDEVKALNNDILKAKKQSELDKEKIAEPAAQIKELTDKIAKIGAENVAKQRELEEELGQEKAKRKEAEIISPKQLEDAFGIIDDLEQKLKQREEQKPEKIEPIREEPKIEPEPVKPEKIEPELKIEKPEPEPIAKKADNLNIFGYERYVPEPRRHRFDYEPRRPREDDRPKYEPEPIREPEPREEPKDPWQEIEDSMKKWAKTESVVDKSLLGGGLRLKLDEYEKNNSEINGERREMIRKYRFFLSYDPVAEAEEARKNAETQRKVADIHRELESKHKQAEIQNETAIKYEDVKQKSVKQEADARQRAIKKKKDELEMGMS